MLDLGVLAILAFIAYLAWSRFLYHLELEQMVGRGVELQPLVERAEQWRLRWGVLIGKLLVLWGVITVAAVMPAAWHDGVLMYFSQVLTGVLYLVVGVVVLRAHRRWAAEAQEQQE